ncbi:hypothetical protein A8990_10389 [Paenibacillus taihuensis]|uniref:Uncharacterized protein n=1 Tax=Paenibacillus taihuensis TaxID=1156355 RepID=A0A3D9SQ43_9BACL|nr:hypothetical protein [Paenibacillus taihuensis]REE92791.1 hypothetical protein A8990_10389 [Paenibacillus taihuensis]
MLNKDQFHCVACGCMLPRYEAERVFLTGFYRVIYPLGWCKSCCRPPEQRNMRMDTVALSMLESNEQLLQYV